MSCLFGVLALTLTAQVGPTAPQATVEGVVRDVESGAPLAGAVLLLADLDRAVVAGGDGRYSIASVPAGPQHLVVQRIGYHARTLHVLIPSDGRLEFNVSLRPDPIRIDGVSARPGRPVRGLDPGDSAAFPDRGITHAALRDHPTLVQSDPLRGLAGGDVLVEPEAPAGMHVRGGAAGHTGFVLDGVPVLNPYHTAGLFSAWNPDALAGLALAGAAPSPALPDALSGAVIARTRQPGAAFRLHSAISNTQARAMVDGPMAGDGSYLLSWRMGLTGPLAPGDEASYLAGETGDLVGTVRVPVRGGTLQLLVYDAEDELAPASAVPDEDGGAGRPPNRFEWASRSVGATWVGTPAPGLTARLGGWHAGAEAGSRWLAAADGATVASSRGDFGFHAALERRSDRAATEAGVRGRSMRTTYRVSGSSPMSWEADGTVAVLTAFGQHARQLTARSEVWAGLAASLAAGDVLLSPRASVRWRATGGLALFAAYSRTHQFTQSLRNAESVVGHVFPAEMAVASGVADVPVAEGDQVVLAADLALHPGLRLGAQAFDRRLGRLLLVAPVESGPFATSAFVLGGATARGASLDLAASGARYGLVASYGLQRVRVSYGDSVYTPRHGTTHTLDAGITVHPTATSSIRLSLAAAMGRTATSVSGPFEWESCNVLDQGCEFAGSPRLLGPLGADRLPAYARVDLGGRKHWHVRVADRDVLIGVFGTLSNVLGRSNTLGHVVDPETGERQPIGMLPLTPLLIGIDTRF